MNSLRNLRVLSAVAAALAAASAAHAAPTGGAVVAGDATISSTPGTTTIQQSSARAAIDWQGFDIGAGETVRFIQPDAQSVALNRVLGADPTRILGSLSANGKVFLVNPHGVLFARGAQVSVGSLVASTREVAVADFMAGHHRFTGSGEGAVLNEGSITAADGGYVALLGARVGNDGRIIATQGSVALAAGSGFTLDVGGDGLLNVAIDAGAVDALARNGGLLQADGGRVLMTARSAGGLLSSAVNNTGIVRAQTLLNRGGTILLLGDSASGSVQVGGVLDASAPDGGHGGFIETSAANVHIGTDALISTAAPGGKTGQWLIDPVDFTIAASGGDVTGATLTSQLATSNVSVLSTAGAAGTRGDLYVNDSITWSANQLSLNAVADIIVNAPLSASGTASLALAYGTGAVAAGNTAALSVRAPVDLPTGNSLTVQLGSDGAVASYSVINSMAALQAINSGLGGNYALGSNLSASGFSGYVPIGTNSTRFTGTFNGLAHTISNLSVSSSSDNAGLFGVTDTTALITSLRMSSTSVAASGRNNAGSLVGWNYGTVRDVYTTGVSISAARQAGGLVGLNSGLIESSASGTGTTTATFFSGGLVAYQVSPGVIRNSYSGVTSRNNLEVGGLVGGMDGGSIENSYANSTPSGSTAVFGTGGLVGYVGGGTVSGSYWNASRYAVGVRTGSATGMTGLTTTQMQTQASFGWDFAKVWVMYEGQTMPLLRAFMTPLTVTANSVAATYSGAAYSGTPGVSYSRTPNMSSVLGTATYAGGGTNVGSYSLTPAGLYSNQLGYLFTFAPGVLTINPYAVSLTGSRNYDGTDVFTPGGLTIGTLAGGQTLSLSGSGTVASKNAGTGKALTLGSLSLVDGTGLASNYTFTGGTHTVNIVPAALTATATAADKAYDGNTIAAATLSATSGLVGSETVSLAPTAAFNTKDVATANLVTVSAVTLGDGMNGGLAANYSLASGQTAVAHITPVALTASAMAADKVYDGDTVAAATLIATSGFVGSETLSFSPTAAFNSKDVATANLVTVSAVTLGDGTNGGLAGNYSLAGGQTAVAHITPRSLTANAVAADKVYDGNTSATATLTATSGLVGGETVNFTSSAAFNSKDVASANLVTVSAVTLGDGTNGGLAGNYSLAAGQTAVARITPRSVVVLNQVASDKTYDGSLAATLSGGVLSGVIGGETVGLIESGLFASAEVGQNITVTATDALSGADALNYALVQPTGLRAAITAVPVPPPVTPTPTPTPTPPAAETPVPVPAAPLPETPVLPDPRTSESWRSAVASAITSRSMQLPSEPATQSPRTHTLLDGLALTVIRDDEQE